MVNLSAVVADPGEYRTFTYSWTVVSGGGYTSPSGNNHEIFSFTPTNQGSYDVRLAVTDADGNTTTADVTVPVLQSSCGPSFSPFQPDEPSVSIAETDPGGTVLAGSPAHFQVSVSPNNMPHDGTVTVFYNTNNGSDSADSDYTSSGDQSLTFSYDSSLNDDQGGYDPQTITVPTSPTANNGNFWVDITRLEDPDANIPGSSYPASNESPPLGSAKATIVHPDLIAETVDTSSIGLMAKLDSTGLATG